MNRPAAIAISSTLYLIAVAGLVLLASYTPLRAQESCATATHRLLEATQLNITADKITTVVDDAAFVNAYTRESGRGIPGGSSPKGILLIEFSSKAYVGLIEQNGCIVYETTIPIQVHELALKAATSGV